MLKIRLQRVGGKNEPRFRFVLTDSKNSTKSGKFLEVLGFHDPREDKTEINAERVKYWMSKGVKVTDTLHNILISKKIISGKKINVLPKKSPIKKEGGEKEVPKAEASAPVVEATEAPSTEVPVEAPAPEAK